MDQNILVVDDYEPVRELLQGCLTHVGYRVTSASDGRSALRAITDIRPDLVLLDVRMPDVSGWDVLSLVRKSPRHQDLPVVMLTGIADDASQAYGWQLGCTCYLTKPIDLEDLLLMVRQVLATSEDSVPPPPAA